MKIDSVYIIESEYFNSLYPFSILHCGFELRCGIYRIFEKYKRLINGININFSARENHLNSFFAREEIQNITPAKENTLIVSSSILPNRAFLNELYTKYNEFLKQRVNDHSSVIFTHGSQPLAAYISKEDVINPIDFDLLFLPKLLKDYSQHFPKIDISLPKIIHFLWDVIDYNGDAIAEDFDLFESNSESNIESYLGAHFLNSNSIKFGKNVKIGPGCVLDANEGPIVIGDNVKIMPNSNIIGPSYIGDNSTIKIGAKIYEKTSIGPWCKIGGEVENSIVHGFSNKQHEGFLGHSYISEWVNLGADTNTSDLKNTYGNIKVRIKNEEYDTQRMFLGLLCGDHTKSAINTSFTTGTISGISGILVHNDFLPNYIPSFAWGSGKNLVRYKIDKAIETIKVVMARRNKTLTKEEELLIRQEYDNP